VEGRDDVTTYDSFESLNDMLHEAVVDLLYGMADDELVIGHHHSVWSGQIPIPDEDLAFSSMARDAMGHARMYYQMLHELGEPDPDTLAFSRKSREFRCASLLSLAKDDWAFSVVRQFLYDAQESVRLAALSQGTLTPLAELARELREEEKRHLAHGRNLVLRLGDSSSKSHDAMQEALDFAYPHALGLFERTDADEPLAQAEICPREEQLRREWESAIAPVLSDTGLAAPEGIEPIIGGRVGKHPKTFAQLLESLQGKRSFDPASRRR
jgi:ring-1,2-phenylacetyl-CoA epoxidase subunit PaaC